MKPLYDTVADMVVVVMIVVTCLVVPQWVSTMF